MKFLIPRYGPKNKFTSKSNIQSLHRHDKTPSPTRKERRSPKPLSYQLFVKSFTTSLPTNFSKVIYDELKNLVAVVVSHLRPIALRKEEKRS